MSSAPRSAETPAAGFSDSNSNLPDAPGEVSVLERPVLPMHAAMSAGAAGGLGGEEPFEIEPTVAVHTDSFSRMGVGVSLSTLGVGIAPSIVLTQFFDLRFMGNFFGYNSGRIESQGYNVYPGLHLASGSSVVDFYPHGVPIRVSAGLMFYNDNHIAATMRFATASSFTLNGETFYAASATAPPLVGYTDLVLHSLRPAPELTFGWGRFIPRSNRHWSFPTEIGVAFTGAPQIVANVSGTVCTDAALTNCGNAANSLSPAGLAFNSALNSKLTSLRKDLNRVQITPIVSGGVAYSFGTPWGLSMMPRARFR
jgi:hypothetical protein